MEDKDEAKKKRTLKNIVDFMFDETAIKITHYKGGRVRMRIPCKHEADFNRKGFDTFVKMKDPDFLKQYGYPDGDYQKAYHGSGFTELYSTAWNAQLKPSCDNRIGDNFGTSPAIYCHGETDRTLEAMFSTYAYYQDLTQQGHTFWAPVWEIAVDRDRKMKNYHSQWLQMPESTIPLALWIEGRNIKDLPYNNYVCKEPIENYEKDPVMYQVLLEDMYRSWDEFKDKPSKWIGIAEGDPKFPLEKTIAEARKRRKKVGSYLALAPKALGDDDRKLEVLEELEPWPEIEDEDW